MQRSAEIAEHQLIIVYEAVVGLRDIRLASIADGISSEQPTKAWKAFAKIVEMNMTPGSLLSKNFSPAKTDSAFQFDNLDLGTFKRQLVELCVEATRIETSDPDLRHYIEGLTISRVIPDAMPLSSTSEALLAGQRTPKIDDLPPDRETLVSEIPNRLTKLARLAKDLDGLQKTHYMLITKYPALNRIHNRACHDYLAARTSQFLLEKIVTESEASSAEAGALYASYKKFRTSLLDNETPPLSNFGNRSTAYSTSLKNLTKVVTSLRGKASAFVTRKHGDAIDSSHKQTTPTRKN